MLVFFDFDGVIVDSFSAAFAVSKMLHPYLEKADYVSRFDGNINDAIAKSIATNEPRTDIHFFAEYGPRLMQCRLFPGMKETIQALAKTHQLVIISSTVTDLIEKYLKLNELDRYFTEVMGNDVHASKIKKIEMATEKYKVGAGECLFVTDTLGDIKEAHHAGVSAVAVTWGYQPKETLERGESFAMVDTADGLLKTLL